MRRFLASSAAVALAFGLAAQTVSTGDQMRSRLRRVGEQLKCQCNCNYTVGSCNMLNCHFREEVNAQIGPLLEAGTGEAAILAKLKDKYGALVLGAPPAEGFNLLGYLMPSVMLVLGLFVVRSTVLRWRRQKAPLAAVGPGVEKFRDEIEKELADLE